MNAHRAGNLCPLQLDCQPWPAWG